MKSKLLVTLTALVAASSAQAALIAGWDFSQYTADGFRSIDDNITVDVLSANYSSLAAIGPASAPFGTMFIDGTNGSTNDSAASLIIPTAALLPVANLGSFENSSVLTSNGQPFFNNLALLGAGSANVVFKADVSSISAFNYETWIFSFGAVTTTSNSLGLAYSTDGISFTGLTSQAITSTDTLYTVALPAITTDELFIRVAFSSSGVDAVAIDHVAINATAIAAIPEPSSYAAIAGTALLGFAALRRRRSA